MKQRKRKTILSSFAHALIRRADDQELGEISRAVVKRYDSLFPDWETMFLSLPRKQPDRQQVLAGLMEFCRTHDMK